MNAKNNQVNANLTAGVVGAAVGAALGASAVVLTDKQKRERIGQAVAELKEKTQTRLSTLRNDSEQIGEEAKEKVKKHAAELNEKTKSVK